MGDDANLLPDGDSGKLRKVCKPSYHPEKVWEFLNQRSAQLWCNMENGTKCDPRAAELLFNRKWILVLVLCNIIVVIFFMYILSAGKQHSPIVVYLENGKNSVTPTLNLSVLNLMELRKLEPFCRVPKNCLDEAIREFLTEPDMVKENAKIIIQCNRTKRVFPSGKGETWIEVNCTGDQMVYEVKEANSKVLMARLGHKPLPLNFSNISVVCRKLAFHHGSEELQRCLGKTLEEFPKEPSVVRDNAKLTVLCGEGNVTFISGTGQNEITVKEDVYGKVQFQVKGQWWAQVVRFFTRGRVH